MFGLAETLLSATERSRLRSAHAVRQKDGPLGAPTTGSMPKRQAFSLWRNRDYLILWSGQAVSALGSGVSEIALPLLVLAITHSPIQAGIVAALGGLPYPLLGITAGVLVDRWDRKRVTMVCDSANALAMLSIAVAIVTGRVSIAQFYIVALITGTPYVFFSPGEDRRYSKTTTSTKVVTNLRL